MEWDLAAASAEELTELAAWIAWYKENREHLLGGELVRVDVPDADVWVHGVVTPERGLFSVVTGAIHGATNLGDVVLPGLEPDAVYDVRPVQVGGTPTPWSPPGWAGGVRMTGRALASVGLRFGAMWPDHVVLVDATRA